MALKVRTPSFNTGGTPVGDVDYRMGQIAALDASGNAVLAGTESAASTNGKPISAPLKASRKGRSAPARRTSSCRNPAAPSANMIVDRLKIVLTHLLPRWRSRPCPYAWGLIFVCAAERMLTCHPAERTAATSPAA